VHWECWAYARWSGFNEHFDRHHSPNHLPTLRKQGFRIMARIIVSGLMVQYPLGGLNQWTLAWLVGLQQLGHEVYFVEKSGTWPLACYDVSKKEMSDDCSYGIGVLDGLLRRFGLQAHWCFVDSKRSYHGMTLGQIRSLFESADLFLDLDGFDWLEEAATVPLRVFVDAEPGWCQIKMEMDRRRAKEWIGHHRYYTVGRNVGTPLSSAPTAGKCWGYLYPPALLDSYRFEPPQRDAPFTTVMNWKSLKGLEFDGQTYGQKDMEFPKFIKLPQLTKARMEVAVSGPDAPKQQIREYGWNVVSADDSAITVDSYRNYILRSRGEFTVAKNVFVATNSGWIGDREAYYMATGRPVVLQDTGFGAHFPVGRGVFAVRTVEEAACAIDSINSDFDNHSKAAHELANEFFSARKVLAKFLGELGF
jgi:hypothetical protein